MSSNCEHSDVKKYGYYYGSQVYRCTMCRSLVMFGDNGYEELSVDEYNEVDRIRP